MLTSFDNSMEEAVDISEDIVDGAIEEDIIDWSMEELGIDASDIADDDGIIEGAEDDEAGANAPVANTASRAVLAIIWKSPGWWSPLRGRCPTSRSIGRSPVVRAETSSACPSSIEPHLARSVRALTED